MKIRIKGNTIRFRVTRPEVAKLAEGAALRESMEFGAGQRLVWILDRGAGFEAAFRDGMVTVRLPASDVERWAAGDDEGIYGTSGTIDIAVEKDFACLGRAADPDAFPNPGKC